jgi:hypothetical protein
MNALRILPVVLLLSAAVSSGGCGTSDAGFKLIHVDDLVAMLGSNEGAVTLLDANGSDFRTKEGVIPGATLLSSYKSYDVEKELPSRKDARLVFYCADSH